MFARRKFGVLFQVFRAERFGNRVFLAEPFAEVNESATLGAKRAEAAVKPVAALLADGTFDGGKLVHLIPVRGLAMVGLEEMSNRFTGRSGLRSGCHAFASVKYNLPGCARLRSG